MPESEIRKRIFVEKSVFNDYEAISDNDIALVHSINRRIRVPDGEMNFNSGCIQRVYRSGALYN